MAALVVSYGYGIELYASGKRFLEYAARSAASCLIVDMQLGDMSGTDLVRDLVKLGLAFPVIFATGSDDGTFRAQAAELGFVAYLQKPISAGLLMSAVALALEPDPG